jgi:hypothetical protein
MPGAPHLAFDTTVQTLPSTSPPVESRIGRARLQPGQKRRAQSALPFCRRLSRVPQSAATPIALLRPSPKSGPPASSLAGMKTYRASKSLCIRSYSICLARV